MNNSNKIFTSTILLLLIISIPNVYSQTLDEELCLTFLSADQVQNITGHDDTLDVRVVDSELSSIKDKVMSGCDVSFENKDHSEIISLSVMVSNTVYNAQSKYAEILFSAESIGFPVQIENGSHWTYNIIEINQAELGNVFYSTKNQWIIGINAPSTETAIEPSVLIELAKVVHTNIDKFEESRKNPIEELATIEPIEPTETIEPIKESPVNEISENETDTTNNSENSDEGGCLIATATYGSELSPQVQQLRELRDNSLLKTKYGTSFITIFNDVYYSFSPTIADLERENPVFREAVKIAITPMISSLSILNYVDMNSEEKVLGYGISLILLNIGMYVGIPASVIVGIKKRS